MAIKLRAENVVMARERAHAVFDLLHTLGFVTKDAAYAWLGSVMALERRETHIGRMHPEQCDKVVELVSERLKKLVAQLRTLSSTRYDQVAASCARIGYDVTCTRCAEHFFTGVVLTEAHDILCTTKGPQ